MGRHRARLPSVLPQGQFLDWEKGFWLNPQEKFSGDPQLQREGQGISASPSLCLLKTAGTSPFPGPLGWGCLLTVNGKGRGSELYPANLTTASVFRNYWYKMT